MTVFVPNDGPHDYTQAETYGELVFLTHGVVNRMDTDALAMQISHKMRDSHIDDHILIASLPIINLIAGAIQAKRHGRLNLLIFQHGSYVERDIEIDDFI